MAKLCIYHTPYDNQGLLRYILPIASYSMVIFHDHQTSMNWPYVYTLWLFNIAMV